ncbi:AraC family transcriptional regulator [Desulfitobacterium sp. AusDCA]|uniref:AraC family transcriptional regulator n=1 Tax=Desulfitobacterium sp. AusDCA TaxID=3240383 RepID=UPI003DA72176
MRVHERGVLKESEYYFFTPSNLAKSLFFYLICTGKFFCDNNYDVKRAKHNSFLLMYIIKGQGTVCYNDKVYPAKENDLVIINCYYPHQYYTKTGWTTLWFHYDGNTSKELFDLVYDRLGCVIPLSNHLVIQKYLNIILENARLSSSLAEPLVSCYIQRILSELLLLSSDFILPIKEEGNPILDAITFIETNYKKQLDLKMIASYVNISPFHFARTFKKNTGYSPYEYVTKTRINQAKILLKKTDLRIKEIAIESGFSSVSNFIINFRNNVGVTPSEFKNTPF